jgi:hypothetical protein
VVPAFSMFGVIWRQPGRASYGRVATSPTQSPARQECHIERRQAQQQPLRLGLELAVRVVNATQDARSTVRALAVRPRMVCLLILGHGIPHSRILAAERL